MLTDFGVCLLVTGACQNSQANFSLLSTSLASMEALTWYLTYKGVSRDGCIVFYGLKEKLAI